MLTHFSLFTGIGGIDLAAEWAGFETVGQCEWADYPTKVLEKHWPDVPRWRDVRDVTIESIRERGVGEITLLSGGFPCQPHSVAGRRKASLDERDLWPEYRRIISEVKPRWILGENVPGILTSESGRFFRGILRDLSELGYSVGWCTYGAVTVGANHKRERVFIIAHSDSFGCHNGQHYRRERYLQSQQNRNAQENKSEWDGWVNRAGEIRSVLPNPASERLERDSGGVPEGEGFAWCDRWKSEPGMVRVANGIPKQVDRIKCLGNTVVPAQAFPILKAIADIERGAAK